MKKLKIGIVGLGFVGQLHIDAIRRIGGAEIVAIADTNTELAKKTAETYGIVSNYTNIDDMLSGSKLDVVHNCTPNCLHKDISLKVIRNGINLFSEKPLTRTVEEAQEIMGVAAQNPQVVLGVNHCYRMNPIIKELRQMIANGEIGTPRLVHGSYLQDHLMYDTDYSWRMDPEVNGPSRAIADIGTHWMDLVQHVLNDRITEVCADLVTAIPVRKKPRHDATTFSRNLSTEYDEISITNEDYGSVFIKTEKGLSGVFSVSQISAGHGCDLRFEVNGSKSSVAWKQEMPNVAWLGYKEAPNCILDRNPITLRTSALPYTHLAKGHPEGWNDAQMNTIKAYYDYVRKPDKQEEPPFTTIAEAFYLMRLVEAILESSKKRAWVKL